MCTFFAESSRISRQRLQEKKKRKEVKIHHRQPQREWSEWIFQFPTIKKQNERTGRDVAALESDFFTAFVHRFEIVFMLYFVFCAENCKWKSEIWKSRNYISRDREIEWSWSSRWEKSNYESNAQKKNRSRVFSDKWKMKEENKWKIGRKSEVKSDLREKNIEKKFFF